MGMGSEMVLICAAPINGSLKLVLTFDAIIYYVKQLFLVRLGLTGLYVTLYVKWFVAVGPIFSSSKLTRI
jgi:hypothetical protein